MTAEKEKPAKKEEMTDDEQFQERLERNYASSERILKRQADVLKKQNEVLEKLKILPEIMEGVKALYKIGVYFKDMMETFQMIDAKADAILAKVDAARRIDHPGPEDCVDMGVLEADDELSRSRVGKKYTINGGGIHPRSSFILSGIKRRKVKHEGVETTAGFSYTFLKKDNPDLLEDLIDLLDEDYQIERTE